MKILRVCYKKTKMTGRKPAHQLTPEPSMRRLAASLVLFLLVFASVGPTSIASVSGNKPLYCRKNGKHHCAEMAERDFQADGPSLRASLPFCPYRNLVLLPTATALPRVGRALADALPEVDSGFFKAVRSPLLFLFFSVCQRGPPPASL
jgi:hypothetical protein